MNIAILVSDVSDDSRKKKDFIEKIDNKITKTNVKIPISLFIHGEIVEKLPTLNNQKKN